MKSIILFSRQFRTLFQVKTEPTDRCTIHCYALFRSCMSPSAHNIQACCLWFNRRLTQPRTPPVLLECWAHTPFCLRMTTIQCDSMFHRQPYFLFSFRSSRQQELLLTFGLDPDRRHTYLRPAPSSLGNTNVGSSPCILKIFKEFKGLPQSSSRIYFLSI